MYIMYLGLTTSTSRAEKAEHGALKRVNYKVLRITPLSNYRKLQLVCGGTQVVPLTLSAPLVQACRMNGCLSPFPSPNVVLGSTRTVRIAFFLGATGTKNTCKNNIEWGKEGAALF